MSTCVWQRYDPRYCHQSKLGSNTKTETGHYKYVQSKRKQGKSRIPNEYEVGDQVILEAPGILRKLSTPCTGPYPVMNIYKYVTIRIQKGIVSERVNIRRITPFNQKPN
jgi:hypothetical protein